MPYLYCMATATTTQEIEMTTTREIENRSPATRLVLILEDQIEVADIEYEHQFSSLANCTLIEWMPGGQYHHLRVEMTDEASALCARLRRELLDARKASA